MIYKELAQKILALSEEQQNQKVVLFGEVVDFINSLIPENSFDKEGGTHRKHGFFEISDIKLIYN